MKINACLALCICSSLLFTRTTSAQSKSAANTLQNPPAGVAIDGDLKDWGDSLRYYNEEKKLNYTLANDKDNIYVAMRFNDRMDQIRVLGAGVTIGIDTKGKKKEAFTLTYPVPAPGETPHPSMAMPKPGENNITQADRDQLVRERLTKLHNIKVSGFPDIEGDMITTSNTYGIHTAVNYDKDGYLVYEASIPLKLFGNFKADKDPWSFNFKINGLARPTEKEEGSGVPHPGGGGGMGGGRGGGMGGGGGGRRGGGGGGGMREGAPGSAGPAADRGEFFKSIDFGEKFYLVN